MILIPRIIYTTDHLFKIYNTNPNIEILKINFKDIRERLNKGNSRDGNFMNYINALSYLI